MLGFGKVCAEKGWIRVEGLLACFVAVVVVVAEGVEGVAGVLLLLLEGP